MAAFIHALIPACPTAVQTRPMMKPDTPYSNSSSPKITKDTQAAEVVKKIMVAAVAAATDGFTPISSIKGPLTMPPPTPKRPAKTPARVQMSGYVIVLVVFHSISSWKT